MAAERDWLRELLKQRDAELREIARDHSGAEEEPADLAVEAPGDTGALSDTDLAELFVVARDALMRAEATLDAQREAYWRAVLAATMAEGARRPTFTEPAHRVPRLRRFLRRHAAVAELRAALAVDAEHDHTA